MRVCVTRPSPDGETTVAALKAVGVEAVHAPLMTIRFLPSRLPALPPGAVLVFTSANGVRAYLAAGGQAGVPAFAVGQATAASAAAAGLDLRGVAAGDVDSLFGLLVAATASGPFLHVRGRHSRGRLVDRLVEAGRDAQAAILYEAVAAEVWPPMLVDTVSSGGGVAFFSPRTAGLFVSLASPRLAADRCDATAFCLSQGVAQALAPFPFATVRIARAPKVPAFVDMVEAAVK